MKKPRGHLPNLVIIGAPKCGTTSLHYYLSRHPRIKMSGRKELNFFIEELNGNMGIAWYKNHFRGEADVYGESSPLYSNRFQYKDVPKIMHETIPEARLIYLLRDPVRRMISHYLHARARGLEKKSLQGALEPLEDSNPYLAFSRYSLQLEAFLDYFPLSRILILTAEELLKARHQTIKSVFRFVGVDDRFYTPDFQRTKNTMGDVNYGSRIAQGLMKAADNSLFHLIPETLRSRMAGLALFAFKKRITTPGLEGRVQERIRAYLRPDLERLRRMTGRRFEEWDT